MLVFKVISIFSLVNMLIFTIILLTKQSAGKEANRRLGIFIFIFTLSQAYVFILYSGFLAHLHRLINADYLIMSMPGYCFYRYINAVTYGKFRFTKRSLLHMLAPLVGFGYYFYTQLSLLNPVEKHERFIYNLEHIPVAESVINALLVVAMLVYFVISFRRIGFYRKQIKKFMSDTEKINLNWIKQLILLFSILLIVLMILVELYGSDNQLYSAAVATGFMLLLSFIFMIKTLLQPVIFSEYKKLSPEYVYEIFSNKAESKIPDSSAGGQLYESILATLKTNKIYLKPNISIKDVACELKIPSKELSSLINKGSKNNFNFFINKLRIEESKQRLQDIRNNKYSIEAIGKDCGFSSRSSFYNSFKKHTGITPTQFQNTTQ